MGRWTDSLLSAVHRMRLRREFSGRRESPQRISNPWHAVSVESGLHACPAVVALRDKRVLSKDAPELPLVNCAHPRGCTCHFRHHSDRRADQRRARDSGLPTGMHIAGAERRGPGRGRRHTDL